MSTRVNSAAIQSVVAACRTEGLNETARRLEHHLAALERPVHEVFVIGRSRVGKSSVINSLLGHRVVPTDVLPCTSVLVDISYGASFVVSVDLPGGMRSVPPADLVSYIAEEQNPHNIRQVGRVEIHHPSPLLAAGLHLFDTPGTDSLHVLHERILLDHLHRADCAIFVYRAPMLGPGPREIDLLRAVQDVSGKLIVIQNDHDGLDDAASQKIASGVQSQLRDHDIRVDRFARLCTTNPREDHLEETRRLVSEATETATSVKHRALARRSRLAARECIARLTVKERASLEPMSELRARLEARKLRLELMRERVGRVRGNWGLQIGSFTQELERHRAALLPSILSGRVESLLASVEPLRELDLQDAVIANLDTWYRQLESLGSTVKAELKRELVKHLADVDTELSSAADVEFVAAFDGLSSIGRRYWELPELIDKPFTGIGDLILKLLGIREWPTRAAELRRGLEADLKQLHDVIETQLDKLVEQLRSELEAHLYETVDARIELLDNVVRSLMQEREASRPRAEASLAAIRKQLASVATAMTTLEGAAR